MPQCRVQNHSLSVAYQMFRSSTVRLSIETPYTPINHCVRSYRPCQRVLGNKIVRREGTQLQCRKRDNVEKEGNQQVTWVMPVRERVLRVNEGMICESASVSSLLKLFQVENIITSRRTLIEKHSRRQNGSRRMATNSDVQFIHSKDHHLSER